MGFKPPICDSIPVIDSELVGRGAARAEDAQGTPTQSHISPSILVYEEKIYVQSSTLLVLLQELKFLS